MDIIIIIKAVMAHSVAVDTHVGNYHINNINLSRLHYCFQTVSIKFKPLLQDALLGEYFKEAGPCLGGRHMWVTAERRTPSRFHLCFIGLQQWAESIQKELS
jgi:hypothetical protein